MGLDKATDQADVSEVLITITGWLNCNLDINRIKMLVKCQDVTPMFTTVVGTQQSVVNGEYIEFNFHELDMQIDNFQ